VETKMSSRPIITGIEVHEFEYTLANMGTDYNGFNLIYEPGNTLTRQACAVRMLTDAGLTGEILSSGTGLATLPLFVHYLIGKNALERDDIYQDVSRALRQWARIGVAAVDVLLWDLAGKYYSAPIWELLGGSPRPLPCYASTYHGDDVDGGLNTPEAYADFAERCLQMGYPAFKIHGWGNAPLEREIATIHAVGRRVGDRMDLMLDPACELKKFGHALKVGWACDDERFFWLEDPYDDGGISQFGHRRLRQLIKTPLLQTEHVRSLQPHVDFAVADATDFMRGDIGYDGITGVMKLAHAAEGLGIDIEIHGAGPAERHCMSSIRNTNYYEMGLLHPKAPSSNIPVYQNYQDGLDAVDEKGCVYPPDGIGLGVDLDWDFIMRNRVDGTRYP
jgi:L-alanine-DL-glutamate epimerase-like enolase superfamily enzyme